MVSFMTPCLISKSNGVSHVNDGLWFTSNNIGRKLRVNITSKPNISKHEKPSLSDP